MAIEPRRRIRPSLEPDLSLDPIGCILGCRTVHNRPVFVRFFPKGPFHTVVSLDLKWEQPPGMLSNTTKGTFVWLIKFICQINKEPKALFPAQAPVSVCRMMDSGVDVDIDMNKNITNGGKTRLSLTVCWFHSSKQKQLGSTLATTQHGHVDLYAPRQ